MKSTIEHVEVYPIFTLDTIEQYLHPSVTEHTDRIHERLQLMEAQQAWQPLSITANKISVKMMNTKRGLQTTELLTEFYRMNKKAVVATPYLLGCIAQYPHLVIGSLQYAQSLEIVEQKEGCILTLPKKGRALHQLCIRRDENKISVAFSVYTSDFNIRADYRTSDNSVMYLTTPVIDAAEKRMLEVLAIERIG